MIFLDASVYIQEPMPEVWHFTQISNIEECQKRFVLMNSNYPLIWGKVGFPTLPNLNQVNGIVVHSLLHFLQQSMRNEQTTSFEIIQANGGLSEMIRNEILTQLKLNVDNPFFQGQRTGIIRNMKSLIATIRTSLVNLLLHLEETGSTFEKKFESQPSVHGLTIGTFTEVWISSKLLPIRGKIDAIRVSQDRIDIYEYKTGKVDYKRHKDQLDFYGLLLMSSDLYKSAKAIHLNLVYSTGQTGTWSFTNQQYKAKYEEIEASITEYQSLETVKETPGEYCIHCSVRFLCSTYMTMIPSGDAFTDTVAKVNENSMSIVTATREDVSKYKFSPSLRNLNLADGIYVLTNLRKHVDNESRQFLLVSTAKSFIVKVA